MKSVVAAALLLGLSAQAHAQAPIKPGATFKDCPTCPEMVVIPPGRLTMGFEGGEPERFEGPVRQVAIGTSFAAGKYEVTNAQYRAFADETKRPTTGNCNVFDGKTTSPVKDGTWRDPQYGRPIKDNEPVVCVTWTDAKAYVDWLAKKTGKPYRLLTEAEWEYIARAGTIGTYAWGEDPAGGCAVANIYDRRGEKENKRPVEAVPCDDGFGGVAPVGSLKANAFGLHDIIGNVWEWTQDCYVMPYAAAPLDGSAYEKQGAACDRRAVRGGSWSSALFRQRPTWRGRDPEDRISQLFGLRVAMDLK
jgi:formylglycine-generating enzyme required for sulfatase activity